LKAEDLGPRLGSNRSYDRPSKERSALARSADLGSASGHWASSGEVWGTACPRSSAVSLPIVHTHLAVVAQRKLQRVYVTRVSFRGAPDYAGCQAFFSLRRSGYGAPRVGSGCSGSRQDLNKRASAQRGTFYPEVTVYATCRQCARPHRTRCRVSWALLLGSRVESQEDPRMLTIASQLLW